MPEQQPIIQIEYDVTDKPFIIGARRCSLCSLDSYWVLYVNGVRRLRLCHDHKGTMLIAMATIVAEFIAELRHA